MDTPGGGFTPEQTVMTLEEYLDKGGEDWFLTGKKEYSIQGMMVSGETSFRNELEVTDYPVTDDGITVILKGRLDEMWTSKLQKVTDTYTKPDGSAVTEADFVKKGQWIDLKTNAESRAYFAMHVPAGISVTAETAWGDILHTNLPNAPHGDGDYLVCRAGEDGKPDFADIWVLNGVLFPVYYDMPGAAEKP